MQLFETWTGADFLAFYAVMLATCAGLGLWLPAILRPPGRGGRVEDPEELALLSGGAQRHALAVLADLYVQGAIDKATGAKVAVTRQDVSASAAGSAVLRKVGAFSLSEAVRSLRDHAQAIEARLIRRGLLLEPGEKRRLGLIAIAPYGALFLLGFYRERAGSALGEPTGFLIVLMTVTALAAAIRFATIHPRTQGGEEVLKDWRRRSSRLKRAPQGGEVSLAVGPFGTAILAGTPYAHVHAMRQSASGSDSGSDSGGDGGGGCGGGCGGCGG
jgi:uncharacterized protein (TIGR04222 family)